jgi:UDP-sugar pyrophosphorylase
MFPGNINVLVIRLASYVRILEESQGIIAEFVNPKYADASKTAFKKPTRLETMMQDLPKLFGEGKKVGVSVFDRRWSFSANKNNIIDAAARHADGGPPESAATAESDFYLYTAGPKIILHPSFAMSLAEVRDKTAGCTLAGEATLILDGPDIRIEGLTLTGRSALAVKACPGARVTVKGTFENEGFEQVLLTEDELSGDRVPEYLRIRGYRFEDRGAAVYEFDRPGEYIVEPR